MIPTSLPPSTTGSAPIFLAAISDAAAATEASGRVVITPRLMMWRTLRGIT